MIKWKKKFISKLNFLKFLFYIFPLMMITSSGYLTAYISIFIFFSLYFFFSSKLKINFLLLDYLVIIFFLTLLISSLINIKEVGNLIFLKSILNLRFAVLFIIIRNIVIFKLINISYLSIITLISSTLLSMDIFLQHLIGFDLFGNSPFAGRYNGFFGHEAIAGSYLQKFFLISVLSIFLIEVNDKIKFFLIVFFINILGLGIFLSLDRMPYLIFIFNILILLIILKKYRFKLLVCFILIFVSFQIFYNNYSIVKERYERIMGQIDIPGILMLFSSNNNNKDSLIFNSKFNDNKIIDNITSDYLKIFISAYNIFLENPFLGSGHKSFPLECARIIENKDKNLKCSTHPHNIYLEILISQGIIGILIFFMFLMILIKKNYFDMNLTKINNKNKIMGIFFFTILICELFPFRSYGSIFTTVNGSWFWFLLAIASSVRPVKRNI